MGSWTMHIFSAAPGYVAASTNPGPARGDPGHRLSIPRSQQQPFYAPASERWRPCLKLREEGSGRCIYLSWKWSRGLDLTPWLWL